LDIIKSYFLRRKKIRIWREEKPGGLRGPHTERRKNHQWEGVEWQDQISLEQGKLGKCIMKKGIHSLGKGREKTVPVIGHGKGESE